ncbi:MAG: glycosyltransferase [Victivallales bacterium]|nr:glycosyltransferase [Victivallales bacterium]
MSTFTCQRCGNCCRWAGIVTASPKEMDAAAALLGMDINAFIQKYTRLNDERTKLIFKDADDGSCIFLNDDNSCRIYSARPSQCRNYPETWDVPPSYQRQCAARQKQLADKQRPVGFAHVLGHPAKPLDVNAAPADAQVMNCRNICLMLEFLKIPYAYYGCPGSVLTGTCGTFVDCGKPTGPWKYRNAWHNLYNKRLSDRLKRHARNNGEPEIILSMYGAAQSDIDCLGLPVIEPMVGYDHCWAPYRVFPSYAQQHVIYALQPELTAQTRFFDTVIPHFLPQEDYFASQSPRDYLLFIGRNTPGKGLDIARKAADSCYMDLKVFHDGLYGRQKAEMIANAAAVMMPTLYVEPFGYVAIEAQLCGTPVITTDWGAFTETVIQGKTGFRCRTHAEFVDAIQRAASLNRLAIRKSAVERFALENVAPQYERYFRFVWEVHTSGGYYAYAAMR